MHIGCAFVGLEAGLTGPVNETDESKSRLLIVATSMGCECCVAVIRGRKRGRGGG